MAYECGGELKAADHVVRVYTPLPRHRELTASGAVF